MNWLLFLQIWLLMSLGAVLYRQRMIYAEESKAYRYTLVIVCSPLGLLVNLASGMFAGLKNYWTFAVESVNGINPSEVKK